MYHETLQFGKQKG